jgi:hypothetical protein
MNEITTIKPGNPVAVIMELAAPIDRARDFVQEGIRDELAPLLAFYDEHGRRPLDPALLQTDQGRKALAAAKHAPAFLKAAARHIKILDAAIGTAASAPEIAAITAVLLDDRNNRGDRQLTASDAIRADCYVAVTITNCEEHRDDNVYDPEGLDTRPRRIDAKREPISRTVAAKAVLDLVGSYKPNFAPSEALYLEFCRSARRYAIDIRSAIIKRANVISAAHDFFMKLAKPATPKIAACDGPATPTKRSPPEK